MPERAAREFSKARTGARVGRPHPLSRHLLQLSPWILRRRQPSTPEPTRRVSLKAPMAERHGYNRATRFRLRVFIASLSTRRLLPWYLSRRARAFTRARTERAP